MWGLAGESWMGDHGRNVFPVASGQEQAECLCG